MPYSKEHAARIRKPDYPKYARKNITEGIDVILGIKDGKSEVQAYRFDKTKFSPEEAQQWLAKEKIRPTSFEPAVEKEMSDDKEDEKIYGAKLPWSKDDATNNEIPPRLPSSPAVPISDSPGLDGATHPETRRVPDVSPQQVGDSGKMPSDPAIDRPSIRAEVGHETNMPVSPLLAPSPDDAGKGRQTMPDPVKQNPVDPGPFQTYKYDVAEIKGVEILREGIWNKVKVSVKDMQEMVQHFKDKVLEPFLNLDHDDKFTDKVKRTLKVAALGYVSDLRIEGNKLIADFKQVPVKIAELIKGGALKKRSVEFYTKDYEQNGRKMDNVLRAVSFFGADVPAVNALSDDFAVLMTRDEKAEKGVIATISFKETKMEIEQKDYEALVALKSTADTLKAEKEELAAKVAENEKTLAELKKFKEEADAAAASEDDKECEAFIKKMVEGGKIDPKHAEVFKKMKKHLKSTMPEGHAAFVEHFGGAKAEMKRAIFAQVPDPKEAVTEIRPKNTSEAHEAIVKFCQEKQLDPMNTDNYSQAMKELGLTQE